MIVLPHSLTVLTTNSCTADCGHCCMNSSRKRKGRFDLDLFKITLGSFLSFSDIRVIVFAGGEPTLLGIKTLSNAIDYARNKGLVSRLVTNASWARTEDHSRRLLSSLREAGLNEINISFDDYHSPYVPDECVVNAWKVARSMDFSAVLISNTCSPSSVISPSYVDMILGENLPRRFNGENVSGFQFKKTNDQFIGISNSSLMYLGRGVALRGVNARNNTELSRQVMKHKCPNVLASPAITPENHLVGCCGFELNGNPVLDLGESSGIDIVKLWEIASDNIIIKAIREVGPGFLLEFAAQKNNNIRIRDDYIGVCEVCQDVIASNTVIEVLISSIDEFAKCLYDRGGR